MFIVGIVIVLFATLALVRSMLSRIGSPINDLREEIKNLEIRISKLDKNQGQ